MLSFLKQKIYLSIETGIVAIICYLVGASLSLNLHHYQSILGGFWCMVSALTILQVMTHDAIEAAKQSFYGACIGSTVALLVCLVAGYHYWSMVVAVTISVFLTICFGLLSSVKMSSANAGLVVALGLYFPNYSAWLNAGLRFSEAFTGIMIALIFVGLSIKLNIRQKPKKYR
ncbi:FUSC family protein [Facilibium subflavum]|uniref:FUSC family protein n=1 Tax=Facilibium subflavum TaxID=2219058 RepID=UPI000E65CFF6|nr:FUSC family protein [Facilibium subflavum]